MSDAVNPTTPDGRVLAWARRSAADYVGKYATSLANLEKVMARRARRRYPDMEAGAALEIARSTARFFADNALVDDAAFAETKARAGMRKGHSKRRIAMGLAAKGVEAETIGTALAEADDLPAALNFARRRRIGPWRNVEADPDRLRKEAASLARNGFSGEIVRKVVGMDLDAVEELSLPIGEAP